MFTGRVLFFHFFFFFLRATSPLSVQLRPLNTNSRQREWGWRGCGIGESRQSLFLREERNVFSRQEEEKKNQIKELLLFSIELSSAIHRQSFLLPLAEESSRVISQQVLENKVFFFPPSLEHSAFIRTQKTVKAHNAGAAFPSASFFLFSDI